MKVLASRCVNYEDLTICAFSPHVPCSCYEAAICLAKEIGWDSN